MKTAISLPDQIFERASLRAIELGVSRSEFFAKAAARYLDALDRQTVTDQINDVLNRTASRDESSVLAARAGREALSTPDDEW